MLSMMPRAGRRPEGISRRRPAATRRDGRRSGGAPSTVLATMIRIRQVEAGDGVEGGLADVLVDCVEGGASVGVMLPLARERAEEFWSGVLDCAARGERIVLVA